MSEKKTKVLFLYCGGTIGQIPREVEVEGQSKSIMFPPEDGNEFELSCKNILDRVTDTRNMTITFETLFAKDSCNIHTDDWQGIAKRIAKAQDDEGYDVVVLTHGTDTLAYSSTALSFALHGSDPKKSGLSIPVIITGAQNSVHVEGGDGQFNLENVFRVADKCVANGVADVLVSFWSRVLLGSRVVKVSEKDFDAFRTIDYPDVGVINALGVKIWPEHAKKRSEASFRMQLADKFDNSVITLEINPSFHPDTIRLIVDCVQPRALLLKAYGPGHVPTEGQYNLAPLIAELSERNIPVILTSRFVGGFVGRLNYEVGLRAIEAGAIPSLDHSREAAEVKARWLIGNDLCHSVEGFKKAFNTSYVGEVSLDK